MAWGFGGKYDPSGNIHFCRALRGLTDSCYDRYVQPAGYTGLSCMGRKDKGQCTQNGWTSWMSGNCGATCRSDRCFNGQVNFMSPCAVYGTDKVVEGYYSIDGFWSDC